jgi:hypothetical protein
MGLEDFIGFEQNSAMDAAAFERFQERVKAAAAQIQASKKEEKKRKKKEDELVKILLKFIKSSDKKDLVLLISRVLEKNVPANFILAIILLGNEEIQREIGEYLSTPKAKPEVLEPNPAKRGNEPEPAAQELSASETGIPEERSLVFFQTDQTMPLKVRIEIDKWIRDLIFQASETPQKLLARAYDVTISANNESTENIFDNNDKSSTSNLVVTKPLTLLVAHVIFNFLKQNGIEEDIVKMKEFAEFLLNGILNRIKEDLGKRKELKEG